MRGHGVRGGLRFSVTTLRPCTHNGRSLAYARRDSNPPSHPRSPRCHHWFAVHGGFAPLQPPGARRRVLSKHARRDSNPPSHPRVLDVTTGLQCLGASPPCNPPVAPASPEQTRAEGLEPPEPPSSSRCHHWFAVHGGFAPLQPPGGAASLEQTRAEGLEPPEPPSSSRCHHWFAVHGGFAPLQPPGGPASLEQTRGGTRTPNPRFRRPMLYPIELRALWETYVTVSGGSALANWRVGGRRLIAPRGLHPRAGCEHQVTRV